MRAIFFILAALTAPGCTLALGLDGLQNGDAGADARSPIDAPLHDVTTSDVPVGTDTGIPDEDAGGTDGGGGGTDGGGTDGGGADGGGADGGMPDGGVTRTVSGTVVGLPTGSTLRLTSGAAMVDVAGTATGDTTFELSVPSGATYDLVATAPAALLCVVYRGHGTATADVSNVFVGCSTAVDLGAYFPFDGSDAATIGLDWTRRTGSFGSFTTDRVGEPDHALGAGTSSAINELDWPLDGRGGGAVPAGSTQATVSMWVRVPAAIPTGSMPDTLFGHYNFAGGAAAFQPEIEWSTGSPRLELFFYWDGGFDRAYTVATTTFARDTWYHVAVTLRGPSSAATFDFERSVYVNGVREGQTVTCCGFDNQTRYWALIGSRIERDELRIYRRRLSDAEILGIYTAGNVP